MTEVSALKVWQDSCHYLYLPRLVNDEVFKNAMHQGVASEDFFGYASGKEGDLTLVEVVQLERTPRKAS